MEMSLLKALLKNISAFLHLSGNKCSEIVEKYYIKNEQVLKLIKPVLESIVDADVASDQALQKEFAGMSQSVDEVRELFEESHPLMSKVYFVLKAESLVTKVQTHCLDILELLQSCEGLPVELSSASLEHCVQKIKHMGYEKPSAIISKAIKEQVEGNEPSSGIRSEIADLLSLKSNQELLIELVALENLKEDAEQLEKIRDVEYIEEMINLVTHMHDCFIEMKQSQSSNTVPIPPDFCCPLSLELMTDPVIVSSGQTYERGYIRNWIDLGLTVCPKTMQTLVHTNLIPNYTVKALIASWCESNNVNLPDPVKSMIRQEEASLVNHVHSSSEDSMPELENESVELNESGERIVDLGGPAAISPPRNESPGCGGADDGSVEHSHGSNEESSPQVVTGNSSDASGEVMAEAHPAVAATSAAPQTDPHEYSLRFRTRPRNPIWRRPSERFGPRIISSVPETRSDLGEIETQVKKLIDDLSGTSLDTVKNATFELRLLARHDKDIRNVIANCGAINLLIGLLYSPDQNIQENAVTALLNLSINDINKTTIGNSNAIEPLIHVLETGSSEAKENSAATLFSLSVIEENKIKIGRSGAIGPLVDLLGNGTPRGKKDAATALFNLSTFHENKGRIVQAGAVRFLVDLMDPAAGLVDKAVAVLSNLATIPEGRARIGQEGGIPMLVEVVELGSARAKENAAAALLQLCTNSNRFCNMVLHEGAIPPLAALSHTGTPRAKEKAQSLLSFFRNQRHGNGGRR
ncbi:putative U box domain, armadillo-like helical, Zinc finger, RING/FYVE/PHD-type [Helianthus annuus]|nr:putative U box domain, armadillo-like helical, Zinc finger, RING/FYVE/PHD-type [Helianthus annuus]